MQPNVALLLDRKYDVSCGGEDHLVRSFPILASAWCAANMLATCNVHAADWLQFGYDAAHSGVNPQETAITRDNVATLVELANVPVPDYVYGAPVLLSGVATALGQRDVLFLSTQGGSLLALDAPRDASNIERLGWDVRRGMSAILNHPWIPTSGPDAITVRGFVYDVDNHALTEVEI